jgi:hypothetical protein
MILWLKLIFLATLLAADSHPFLILLASFLLKNTGHAYKMQALQQNWHVLARKISFTFIHAAF